MSIKPIVMSGMLQRTDDVGAMKHQQDSRPAVEQQNLQSQISKKTEAQRHQVVSKEESAKADTHADAREEGKNQYFFRKKIIKKEEENMETSTYQENLGGGFDMKI